MFENIKSSYEESIQRTHWADDETKEATLTKIHSMTAYIGFDDSLLDSKTIDREYRKVFSLQITIKKYGYQYEFSKIGC